MLLALLCTSTNTPWYGVAYALPEHPLPTFNHGSALGGRARTKKEWRTDFGVFWLQVPFNRGAGSVVGGVLWYATRTAR